MGEELDIPEGDNEFFEDDVDSLDLD